MGDVNFVIFDNILFGYSGLFIVLGYLFKGYVMMLGFGILPGEFSGGFAESLNGFEWSLLSGDSWSS